MYFSDEIRMDCLGRDKTSVEEIVDTDDIINKDLPLNELSYNEDLVYVIDAPHYRLFIEYWADSCWDAFEEKYEFVSAKNFETYIIPRMKDIGEKLNLELINWYYVPDPEVIDEWEGFGEGFEHPTGTAVFIYKKR